MCAGWWWPGRYHACDIKTPLSMMTLTSFKDEIMARLAASGGGNRAEMVLVAPNTPMQAAEVIAEATHLTEEPFMQNVLRSMPQPAGPLAAIYWVESKASADPVHFPIGPPRGGGLALFR